MHIDPGLPKLSAPCLKQIHQLLREDSNRRGDVEVKLFTLLQAQLLKPREVSMVIMVMAMTPGSGYSKLNSTSVGKWKNNEIRHGEWSCERSGFRMFASCMRWCGYEMVMLYTFQTNYFKPKHDVVLQELCFHQWF